LFRTQWPAGTLHFNGCTMQKDHVHHMIKNVNCIELMDVSPIFIINMKTLAGACVLNYPCPVKNITFLFVRTYCLVLYKRVQYSHRVKLNYYECGQVYKTLLGNFIIIHSTIYDIKNMRNTLVDNPSWLKYIIVLTDVNRPLFRLNCSTKQHNIIYVSVLFNFWWNMNAHIKTSQWKDKYV